MKKIISVVLAAIMLIMNGCIVFADVSEISEIDNLHSENTTINENDSLFIPDNSMVTANNRILLGTGYCTGDGVKLKSTPSASGTTLGLMYKGEAIKVYD